MPLKPPRVTVRLGVSKHDPADLGFFYQALDAGTAWLRRRCTALPELPVVSVDISVEMLENVSPLWRCFISGAGVLARPWPVLRSVLRTAVPVGPRVVTLALLSPLGSPGPSGPVHPVGVTPGSSTGGIRRRRGCREDAKDRTRSMHVSVEVLADCLVGRLTVLISRR